LPDGHTLRFEYFQFPDPIYRLKSRFDPLTWPYYALWQFAIRKVVARLHAEQPFDLVHHVTFVSFRIPIWLKSLGVPVIFGPVGGADTAPYKLLGRGFGFGIRCKEILRNLLTWVNVAVMRALPPIVRNRGLCLATTPAMSTIFDRVGLSHEMFPAVGIDVGQKRESRKPGSIRFLYVGRFHPLKGTHLLLEAFARANIAGARLTLIGSGREESRLRQLAQTLKIADHLEWVGQVPRVQLHDWYRSHDVLVAPSLYESGGLVVLEAMAEGTPAIVLDVGGHSISVADGCGFRISTDGHDDQVINRLVAAMTAYANDFDRIQKDGERARQQVIRHYEWSHKAKRMRVIYERLIAQN